MLDAVFPVDARIATAIAAVLLAGFAKGVTGIGLPVIGVPILVALYGDLRAVLLVTIFATALSDVPFIIRGRRHVREAVFLIGFLIAGLIGIIIGTRILVSVRPAILTLILAIVLIVFIVISWMGKMPQMDHARASRWGPVIGILAGALQGSTGASGPLVTSYLVSMDLSRGLFLFSISIIFTVLDWTQLGSLARLGLYTPYLLIVAAAIVLTMALGMLVGFAAQKHINDVVFRRGVLGVLSLAAISLLVSSLRGLR